MGGNSPAKSTPRDMNNQVIVAFEQTLKELQLKIKQQDRDLSFKEEEVKHYKKMARDLVE